MTLQEARTLLGISQVRLDRAAGLAKGTVNDIECGRNERPAHETVVRIVRALREFGLAGANTETLFPVPSDTAERAS